MFDSDSMIDIIGEKKYHVNKTLTGRIFAFKKKN